jgi:acyl-homoserine-lactone acylase
MITRLWRMIGGALCFALLAAACSREPAPDAADAATRPAPALPGSGSDAGRTVIYRDRFGVPHIYAPTVEAGLFAMGYAQAEDRPHQLLRNLMSAIGERSAIDGETAIADDLRARMFDHYGASATAVEVMPMERRRYLEAFSAGIRAWYAAHPGDVPEWWGARSVDAVMVDAFARFFLYNWSIGEAYGDLRRGGVEAGFDDEERASNQWAIAPSRTADGHAILVIDPHLSWWGPSRFWEVRIHAGALRGSGVGLPGSPFIGLGHNAHVAWAMTTGGPDTADVYELTLDAARPGHYLYDGEWRPLKSRSVTLEVRDSGPVERRLEFSHHGPVIARRGNRAWAAKIPYDATTDRNLAWSLLNFAEDYRGVVAATETLAMFPQNIMAADTRGNIYYQRTGRVPIRPDGYDWSKPVDGSTSATEWLGLHPASDHLQVLNPPHGYMQNNNTPPDAMMVESVFDPREWKDYLFSSAHYGPARSGWNNQRGARALEHLHGRDGITLVDVMDQVLDVRPYGIERWLAALRESVDAHDDAERSALDALAAWSLELTADSVAALTYAYWRFELESGADAAAFAGVRAAIDDHYAIAEGRDPKPVRLDDGQRRLLAGAFRRALERLDTEFGARRATFGDVFRVGRDGKSWPVEGGAADQHGLSTLRTVGYGRPNARRERYAEHGQTSTQIVMLSKPVRSWIYLPVGQSDRPESPHYHDQAEQLFSPRVLKPSWWRPEELAPNVVSRVELEVPDAF